MCQCLDAVNCIKFHKSVQWSLSTVAMHCLTDSTDGRKSLPLLLPMYSLLPLTKGHLSNVATISWQIGWPY